MTVPRHERRKKGRRRYVEEAETFRLLEGDCVEVMAELKPESVDAIVTDPPYGLEFMGRDWDRLRGRKNCKSASRAQSIQDWHFAWAVEAIRLLKPGGHLLAFGGTRTYHRLTSAIEDAGFEIRDSILWLYGSGFPKSLNVSKAIAKRCGDSSLSAALEWDGWGTALKPAHEPIVVARKPLIGTVAENVLKHGTGGLNVDACRITGAKGNGNWAGSSGERPDDVFDGGWAERRTTQNAAGRWPANVVLSHRDDCELEVTWDASGEGRGKGDRWHCVAGCAVAELDAQSGVLKTGRLRAGTRRKGIGFRGGLGTEVRNEFPANAGGASRFFYCAKASRTERNAGLDGFKRQALNWSSGDKSPGTFQSAGTERSAPNHHPTVKPIDLDRQLCRLVTPPRGTILVPFAGSGSEMCAAILEGFHVIGIECESDYCRIAEARCRHWLRQIEPGGDSSAC